MHTFNDWTSPKNTGADAPDAPPPAPGCAGCRGRARLALFLAVVFAAGGALVGYIAAEVFRPATPAERAAFDRFMSPASPAAALGDNALDALGGSNGGHVKFVTPGSPARIIRVGDRLYMVSPVVFSQVTVDEQLQREQPTP